MANPSFMMQQPIAAYNFSDFPDPSFNANRLCIALDRNNAIYQSNGTAWISVSSNIGNTQKNTIVSLGDSIFQNGLITSATSNIITARSIMDQAAAKLGQRLRFIHNGGVSGNTTTQSLARFNTDVLPYQPAWVIVDFGVNDFVTPRKGVDVFADLVTMYNMTIGMGAEFITVGAAAAGGFNVAANFTQYAITMNLCMQAAITKPGWRHFPWSVAITDFSTLTNSYFCIPQAGTCYDNQTHPTAFGSDKISTLLLNFFNTILPGEFMGTGANHSGANGDTQNLVSDGMAIDTTGTTVIGPIAGITGTYSGFWFPARNGSIASAMSQTLRDPTTGQPGNWQVFTLTGAAANTDYITYAQSIDVSALGLRVGDKYYVECDIVATTSSGTLNQLEIQVQQLDSAFNILYTSVWNRIDATPEYLGWSGFTGRASNYSAPLIVNAPSGALAPLTKTLLVTIKMATSVAGAAIVKIGDVNLRKVVS